MVKLSIASSHMILQWWYKANSLLNGIFTSYLCYKSFTRIWYIYIVVHIYGTERSAMKLQCYQTKFGTVTKIR